MIDQRLDELIDRHLNGVIADREIAELEERLLHSAADRERFWKLAEVHSLLHEHLQEELRVGETHLSCLSDEPQSSLSGRKPTVVSKLFQGPWRTIAALAAGIVIGLGGASAVWAMVGGHLSASAFAPLPLLDGSFESSQAPQSDGVPTKVGVWSGDFAAIAEDADQITPIAGRRMLQFLRGDNQRTPPEVKSSVAEMWQVVKLDPARLKSSQQSQVVEVSAKFNATAKAGAERVAFGISVLAFAGDIAQAPELWQERRELALAISDKEELADAEPGSWQNLTAQVSVPPEANLLFVQLRVTRKGAGPLRQEFGEHYVDDVVLGVRSGI